MKRLKRYFGTGLLVVLPIVLTVYLFVLIFKLIDGILGVIINSYLKTVLGFSIPGVGLVTGMLLILIIGFIVSHLFSGKLGTMVEGAFLKLPGVRLIYPPLRQIVGFIFSKEKAAFKKVVMVEYPSRGIWSIGFMTNDGFKEAQEKAGQELIHVLIGTTPSPWSGFFIMVPKNHVKFLEISIEDGIKLIVSGGILKPA